MKQGIMTISALTLLLTLTAVSPVSAENRRSHTETMSVDAGSDGAWFQNIDFTDLTYEGEAGRTTFDIEITYSAKDISEEDFADLLEDFDLEIEHENETTVFHLVHPKHGKGFSHWPFSRKKNDWRVKLTVAGPAGRSCRIDGGFSEIKTANTAGMYELDADFSEIRIHDHSGSLILKTEFSDIDTRNLSGSIDIKAEFSDIDIAMAGVSGQSNASVNFGELSIHLPRGTQAFFNSDKSFGDINFNIDGILSYNSSNNTRILNEGGASGVKFDLKASFGGITVSDDMPDRPDGSKTGDAGNSPSLPAGRSDYDIDYSFTEGAVSEINIRGTRFVDKEYVREILGIEQGKSYTKEAIDTAVKSLPGKNKRIRHASFTIKRDGRLSVYIDEEYPYRPHFDGIASFSRVGGLGLGPRLKITSVYGPISEIGGGAEYHFANKEWTYDLKAGTEFFATNTLGIGVTHRLVYESTMDWAVPEEEASANAFFLGRETVNLYEVEGTTGYITQSFGDNITLGAEYFEETYNSLKKHTNWSLFNANHRKFDNPPIASGYDDTIKGMRYNLTLRKSGRDSHAAFSIAAEQALDTGNQVIPEYTRYLGTLNLTTRASYVDLLKVRLAGGYSDDLLPPQKSFRLGGTNTLRGFAPGMVPEPAAGADGFSYLGGGNRMLLANIDYFIGFKENMHSDLRFILFGDIGGVWRKGEEVDLKDVRRDLGVGIALNGDFLSPQAAEEEDILDTFRINWAVPVGNVSHKSYWTVNFVRTY